MVKEIQDYRWSSYKLNIQSKTSKLIDRNENPVFMGLAGQEGEATQVYRHLMAQDIEEKKLNAVRKSIEGGVGYMSERFEKQLAEMLPKKVKRGRPKRNRIIV